jgi:hypothetical protein
MTRSWRVTRRKKKRRQRRREKPKYKLPEGSVQSSGHELETRYEISEQKFHLED